MEETVFKNVTSSNLTAEAFRQGMHFLQLIPPPFLIVLGTTGNVAAYYVVGKSVRLRKESASIYLRLYFAVSVFVLIIGSGQDWICYVSGLPFLWNLSDYSCRLWEFASSLLFYYPPWALSSLLVDRVLQATRRDIALQICDVFSAKAISILILVSLTTVTVHVLWTFELHPFFGCVIPPDRQDFHSKVWPWVSVIVYSFIPAAILVVCSIILFVIRCEFMKKSCQEEIGFDDEFEMMRFVQSSRNKSVDTQVDVLESSSVNTPSPPGSMIKKSHNMANLNEPDLACLAEEPSCDKASFEETQELSAECSSTEEPAGALFSRRKLGMIPPPFLTDLSLSMALFSVLSTLPATIVNVVLMQVPTNQQWDEVKMEKLKFVFVVFQTLVVFNKAFIPYLAFLTSSDLRKEARKFFFSTNNRRDRSSFELTETHDVTKQDQVAAV